MKDFAGQIFQQFPVMSKKWSRGTVELPAL